MKQLSRIVLHAVVLVLTIVPFALSCKPIQAIHLVSNASCPANTHTYGEATYGIVSPDYRVEFHANNMKPGVSGPTYPAHITAEQWVLMRNGGWIEVGIINGTDVWPDTPTPSTTAYSFFWADSSGCNQNEAWIHTIRNTVPDGTDHTFEIDYANNSLKDWYVVLDGQIVGVSTITHSNEPYQQNIGIELGETNGVCGNGTVDDLKFADQFNMIPSTWRNGQGWVNWPASNVNTDAGPTFHAVWNTAPGEPNLLLVSKDRC